MDSQTDEESITSLIKGAVIKSLAIGREEVRLTVKDFLNEKFTVVIDKDLRVRIERDEQKANK